MRPDPSIDASLEEMTQLIGRMMRGIKGAGGRQDAAELVGRMKAEGLGPRHVQVLMALVLNGPAPVGAIARHTALNPATASQLVGELERGGFVTRRADERDRRRMIVSLAEAHCELVERFARQRLRPFRMTLEALSPVEREHFLHGWRTLVECIERAGQEEQPEDGANRPGGAASDPGCPGAARPRE